MDNNLVEEIIDLLEISEWGDSYNDLEDIDGVEIVEEGEWKQEHKYQFSETIFKYKDRFFCLQETRSGSYHTDWYYNTPEVYEVERKVKTVEIVDWVAV